MHITYGKYQDDDHDILLMESIKMMTMTLAICGFIGCQVCTSRQGTIKEGNMINFHAFPSAPFMQVRSHRYKKV